MKIKLIVVLLIVTTLNINSQKLTSKTFIRHQITNSKKIIKQALTYNDAQTAISNLHKIIALEGSKSIYKDSLAIVYFQSRNYVSSHLLAKELLALKPNNKQLLEINAISLEKLNAVKDAIDAYERLFQQTNNMLHGYQLANLQFSIKRLTEAKVSIEKTIVCEKIEKAFIQFPVDKTKNQNVPLKSAAYNLQGLISFELKEYSFARTAFKNALEVMPKFTLATQNANAVLLQIENKKENENK